QEPYLGPDGRGVFLVTRYGKRKAAAVGDKEQGPAAHESVSYLECWDVTTSPPCRRWPAVCLGHNRPEATGNRANVYVVFSPGGTSAAAWDGREVAVFRLSDGKEQWRAPCTRPGRLFGVSDDGKRVAFQEAVLLTVLEKEGPAHPRELVFRYAGGG